MSQSWLRKTLREATAAASSTERPRLADWIASVAPDLDRFDYFAPYVEALERAIGGNLRLGCAAPPQHGKTLLTLYALLWLARYFPGYSHAYVTFNETRAEEVAKDFRRLAQSVGLVPGGTLHKVEFAGGTSVKFTSVKGDLTGSPINGLCVIDDPIKDARDARSATVRKDAVDWWKSVARARRHAGTSFIVMATRWHMDDLTGYLVKEEGWQYLNFKAIAEPANTNDIGSDGRVVSDPIHRLPGESLCPSRKPPEFFDEERTDAYFWAAQYQGEPRPIGGAIFREPTYYKPGQLPAQGFRVAYGVDLAYAKKSANDYSVCVEIWAVKDENNRDKEDRAITTFYVVDVQRKQVDAPSFTLTLRAKLSQRRAKFYWYAGGTEIGSADFIKAKNIPLVLLPIRGDKLARAQRTAELWNLGRIQLPLAEGDDEADSSIDWVAPFVDEITSFTGVNDAKDDQVDALVPAIDMLEKHHNEIDLTGGGGGRGWTRA